MFRSEPIEDPLFSAKLRLSRAHRHIDDLEAQIEQFFAETRFIRATELDPDGIHAIHKIILDKPFHVDWCLLATEIIEHLRASLDHAVYATRTVDRTRCAYFPCAKFSEIDNAIKGWAKDIPPEIQSLLRTFDPHDRGDNLLYPLNDLCNASKHGLIMLVAAVGAGIEITSGGGTDVQFIDPVMWDGEKHEIKYARTKRGLHFQHEGKIKIFVALQDIEGRGVSRDPATHVFRTMLFECTNIVRAIEAEGTRIGIFK